MIKLKIKRIYSAISGPRYNVYLNEGWRYFGFWGFLREFHREIDAVSYINNFPKSEIAIQQREKALNEELYSKYNKVITIPNDNFESQIGHLSLTNEKRNDRL